MAYDSLKALIRQYIKTNGEQEITGQILQDVLIAMVNDYPDISGYATQSWVTTQLGGYLPLTGGTLTGDLNFTNTYGSGSIFVDSIDFDLNITASNMIYLDAVRGVSVNGNITTTSFIKSGGTSSQFLKADGSVDSNAYITASALSGYLPLTGGTITGNLTVDGNVGIGITSPTHKFEVGYGDAYIHGGLIVDSNFAVKNGDLTIWSPQNYTILPKSQYVIENVTWSRIEMGTDGAFYFRQGASGTNTYRPIYAASFNQGSDLRKKTITGDVPINLYNVANAPLFKFTWNDEKEYSGQHIGSAAQYWQTVLPELVSIGRDADMTLAMQYDVIALASAITVAKTVVNHEERIILLERENEALKKEIADLKSA